MPSRYARRCGRKVWGQGRDFERTLEPSRDGGGCRPLRNFESRNENGGLAGRRRLRRLCRKLLGRKRPCWAPWKRETTCWKRNGYAGQRRVAASWKKAICVTKRRGEEAAQTRRYEQSRGYERKQFVIDELTSEEKESNSAYHRECVRAWDGISVPSPTKVALAESSQRCASLPRRSEAQAQGNQRVQAEAAGCERALGIWAAAKDKLHVKLPEDIDLEFSGKAYPLGYVGDGILPTEGGDGVSSGPTSTCRLAIGSSRASTQHCLPWQRGGKVSALHGQGSAEASMTKSRASLSQGSAGCVRLKR